jgi:Domain of Unknown Function (DUF1259)
MQKLSVLLLSGALVASAAVAHAQDVDWKQVDAAFGRSPAAVAGDVHRYGFPRTDLTVTLDGVTIRPALALGGWIALKPMHGEAMAMGDLVLLETEINPVVTKMIESGIEITAVHNHLLRGNPATFYMTSVATAIRSSWRPPSERRLPKAKLRSGHPPRRPHHRQRLISIPRPSIKSSASRARPTVASISLQSRGVTRSKWREPHSPRPDL